MSETYAPGDTNAYEVRTDTLCEGWVNCWHLGDHLQTFATFEAAMAGIEEFISDLRESRAHHGEPFSEEDAEAERSQLGVFHRFTGEPVDRAPTAPNMTTVNQTSAPLSSVKAPAQETVRQKDLMQLVLYHGRKSPDQEMDDWGFDGPALKGVERIQYTYGHLYVFFSNPAFCEAAKAATGWSDHADNALQVGQHDDLLQAADSYYGDFYLEVVSDDVSPRTTEG